VSSPTRSLVRLVSVLTICCLTASLLSAEESQPRWVTNEVEWVGEVAQCFGFSVSETARLWRRLQAAAESSTMTSPQLRQFFATLAIMTQRAQSTPADAAAALQLFESGFILGYLTTVDVRTLNVYLPGARALMAQGLGGTPEQLESAANAGALWTSVAVAALGSQVAKLVTAQGQGSAQCGFWSSPTPSLPPAPPDKEAPREQKKGRSATTKSKMQATTGTAYYHSNGNHSGMILLKTASDLLDLTWDSKSQLNFSDLPSDLKLSGPVPVTRAWNNGAVWRVQYSKEDNGYGRFFLHIDKGTFAGEVNTAIDAASMLIRKYYELLARRMYTEAYGLFSEGHKAHTTIEDLGQTSETFTSPADVDFCSTPSCIDIKIVSHDKAKVLVRVYIGLLKKRDHTCYKNTDTCYSQHTIINIGGSWYIDDTQNIRDF
jgi:hypothetical protein